MQPTMVMFTAVATLLACHQTREDQGARITPSEDRIEEVEAASYRGPAVPSTALAAESRTGGVVGAVYGCDGHPLRGVQLEARRLATEARSATDTLVQMVDSTFTLRSLTPGDWHLYFRGVGYRARLVRVAIDRGRVDTVMVQMSGGSPGLIRDCMCANGQGFGGQCCKPVTIQVCTTREASRQGQ
jgi:hypothetical protein